MSEIIAGRNGARNAEPTLTERRSQEDLRMAGPANSALTRVFIVRRTIARIRQTDGNVLRVSFAEFTPDPLAPSPRAAGGRHG